MAVQARHPTEAFMVMEGVTVGSPVCFDEFGGCAPTTVFGGTQVPTDFPHSETMTCNYGFVPRKRAQAAEVVQGFLEGPAATQGLGLVSFGDVRGRPLNSGAASTSGGTANGASVYEDLTSRLYQQGAEIDALVTRERMRAGLEEVRRRHARALMAATERAASGRLRAAEAELERALRRSAELEEKARQAAAECQAWMGVARSHEAVAAGLRATLDQLLLQSSPPCVAAAVGEGDVEDAQSCCFEAAPDGNDDGAASRVRAVASSCKRCGGGEACVLLLPCRHLCLCQACEAAADSCPVCAAAKNASLHVLLS